MNIPVKILTGCWIIFFLYWIINVLNAKKTAEERGKRLIIIDGPPGIGCPVISSVTGADAVLIVATLQAGYGQVIGLSMAEADGAQGVQILVNIREDNLMPFPSIAERCTDAKNARKLRDLNP